MPLPLRAIEVGYEQLVRAADAIASAGGHGHIHTTAPGCALTASPRRAIVLEATGDGVVYAFFDVEPIEARARPLAIMLHGAESVPDEDEELAPACEAVRAMADRMKAGKGHFHILGPPCLANSHAGKWTILFEDSERGMLESVTDDRPLAEIRLIERLIYA